ncbi:unnamed protein product [Adineta ricciae]|uniref:Uncharacterized protein n=1 Tax=Adineta ricciae TaxID=249248 RepID=A0A815S958_ADIRI|nr:unnamed protein product [Adineta ricciae]CAF1487862.1 unnamed protein product [Adineta ricciae]
MSVSNSSFDQEKYFLPSTIQLIVSVTDRISYSVYAIALIFSVVQTFRRNQTLDRFLSYVVHEYSDGKFDSNQVYIRKQVITCYRYDQHFSYIPHPNRLMLFTVAVHVQVLMLIAIRTLFLRQSIAISDCVSFDFPLDVLQCDNNQSPCSSNGTESVVKCTYYSFQTTNIITAVTSVSTWHYALRYCVVKLIRFARWSTFRNDDQPRNFCCWRTTPCRLRCIMYVDYTMLWIYLLVTCILGLGWNKSLYQLPVDTFGSVWTPIIIAADRIYTLSMALIPELLQNWLDVTRNGEVLQVLKSNDLLLTNLEPLIQLTRKEKRPPSVTTDKLVHDSATEQQSYM